MAFQNELNATDRFEAGFGFFYTDFSIFFFLQVLEFRYNFSNQLILQKRCQLSESNSKILSAFQAVAFVMSCNQFCETIV